MMENLSLGLIGWPLEHSLSPQMHNAALMDLGISGDYRLYPIPPAENREKIGELLAEMRAGRIHGLNVTIPYKWDVQDLADNRSDVVETIGAANTLYYRDGELCADNTDVPGLHTSLFKSLHNKGSFYRDTFGSILILGAGGAARAAIYVASQMNRPVYLAARRIEQARELAIDLAQKIAVSINPVKLSTEGLERLPEVDLVINTTPAGMWPHVDAMPWPDDLPVSAEAVLDMIYNPPVTRFMRKAIKSGAKVVNGLDMLVEQAALSLEIWTDRSVSREVMKTAALDELENRNLDSSQLRKF